MTLGPELVIAVASDIHAYERGGEDVAAPSHYEITTAMSEVGSNPVYALKQLIEREGIKADLLLCPGDLGHQARPSAISHAWQQLQVLASAMGGARLVASSGNHDVDSRNTYNDHDAKGVLLDLEPPYPLLEMELCDRYWARNFAVVAEPRYRLVVLNSCAYHGTGSLQEHLHGRVAERTLARLKSALQSTPAPPVNVLLCHHHPQPHMELKLGDYDVMKNGQLLLDLLGEGGFGRWLVVHGHKHHPKIVYASGSSTSPVILSAGSLCAQLFLELQTKARNQFHLVRFSLEEVKARGLVGTVQSWDWAFGEGWVEAGARSGLPRFCGFGTRLDPLVLAREIVEVYREGLKLWDDICDRLPAVKYLLPGDLRNIAGSLEEAYRLTLVEANGMIVEVGPCE